MRNSNLLPVNANGEVRLRSVVSRGKRGRHVHAELQTIFSVPVVGASVLDGIEHAVSSSPRNMDTTAGGASFAPRRWSLLAVARRAEQILIIVHGLNDRAEEEQETARSGAACRRASRRLTPVSVAERPVVVLAGAVHAVERLFVQQADKAVARRDLFMTPWSSWLWSVAMFAVAKIGRELVLRGGDLVVLGLGKHAELPQLLVQIAMNAATRGLIAPK